MAPSFGAMMSSFWHTMTSNDRHASFDSPFRTGKPVPIRQNSDGPRSPPLTSITTVGIDSRHSINSPYSDEPGNRSTTALHHHSDHENGTASPGSPYSPGMRSASASKQLAPENHRDGPVGPGEIQLQNFHEGLPPPPPVSHSWKRIDRWSEDNYPELYDQLGVGATLNDLNELEHDLDCSLPMEVRESLMIHDGQERGGTPSGILFGCMLLDCEEILQEWHQWKTVGREFLAITAEPLRTPPRTPLKAFGSSSSDVPAPSQQPQQSLGKQELLARQMSCPPGAVQKVYAHPGWVPLARDWGGNNIGVDLAPGPKGRWGQVILFGRDYDCKYVISRSWASFLATVADDMGTSKWFIDEETGELKLREFKSDRVEPGYMDILRWRMDQKYGLKGPRRKPGSPRAHSPTNANGEPLPFKTNGDLDHSRGRSMNRFSGGGPSQTSPRPFVSTSSPLARVAEELPAPVKVYTSQADAKVAKPDKDGEPLMELNTPKLGNDEKKGDENPFPGDKAKTADKGLTDGLESISLGGEKKAPLSNISNIVPEGSPLVDGDGRRGLEV